MSSIFNDRQKRNSSTPIIIFLCILFLFLGIAAFLLAFSQAANKVDDEISKDTGESSQQISSEDIPSQESTPESTDTDGTNIENTTSDKYDYSSEVPTSTKQPLEYLDDAAFLGDSITEGMKLHNQSNAFISSATSMSIKTAMASPQATYNNQTLLDALNAVNPKKIYVMLGSNEVGGYDLDIYISRYGELIDSLKSSNPDSIIYIQSLTPVTKAYHESGEILNNDHINNANAQLKLLAYEKKVFFIDVNSALIEEDGFLLNDASPKDGVHFGTTHFNKWIDYLLSHTIDYDTFISDKDTYFAP